MIFNSIFGFILIYLLTKLLTMKPSAPKSTLWLLALIVGILGIVGHFVAIPFVSVYSFWLILAGFVMLALGTTFKGV